jgi:outer membrane protein OmpA-like peptidoglycan-associated protein
VIFEIVSQIVYSPKTCTMNRKIIIPNAAYFILIFLYSCKDSNETSNKKTNLTETPGISDSSFLEAIDSSFSISSDSSFMSYQSESYYFSSETYSSSEFYEEDSNVSIISSSKEESGVMVSKETPIRLIARDIRPIRIPHHINSSSSDYHPAISPDGKTLRFTGMDRTGYFDNKIDFTKTKNAGGEDIFISVHKNGLWQDATALKIINTNGHEAVTQSVSNGDLLLSGNFPENMGPDENSNGSNTCDLFLAIKNKNYQLYHFDEPINSIFSELDGYLSPDGKFLLFCSDRPNPKSKYHKKGWLWNESYWGNTDVYVSFKEGDSWSVPKQLENGINTEFTERTPWLSYDGMTLFLSSNGYNPDKKDLDIYFFTRKNKNDWDHWEGPYEITHLNGATDDWGYQEDMAGNGFFARGIKLGYKPTKKAKDGTGFVFETNFRSGYEIHGLQSGSFQKDEQTDIFTVNKNNVAITLPDILFEVDSYELSPAFTALKETIIDYIKINGPKTILIEGHTDSDGTETHNNTLSLNRANAIKKFIDKEMSGLHIQCEGKGSREPVAPNTNPEGKRKNRRVEIYFK